MIWRIWISKKRRFLVCRERWRSLQIGLSNNPNNIINRIKRFIRHRPRDDPILLFPRRNNAHFRPLPSSREKNLRTPFYKFWPTRRRQHNLSFLRTHVVEHPIRDLQRDRTRRHRRRQRWRVARKRLFRKYLHRDGNAGEARIRRHRCEFQNDDECDQACIENVQNAMKDKENEQRWRRRRRRRRKKPDTDEQCDNVCAWSEFADVQRFETWDERSGRISCFWFQKKRKMRRLADETEFLTHTIPYRLTFFFHDFSKSALSVPSARFFSFSNSATASLTPSLSPRSSLFCFQPISRRLFAPLDFRWTRRIMLRLRSFDRLSRDRTCKWKNMKKTFERRWKMKNDETIEWFWRWRIDERRSKNRMRGRRRNEWKNEMRIWRHCSRRRRIWKERCEMIEYVRLNIEKKIEWDRALNVAYFQPKSEASWNAKRGS